MAIRLPVTATPQAGESEGSWVILSAGEPVGKLTLVPTPTGFKAEAVAARGQEHYADFAERAAAEAVARSPLSKERNVMRRSILSTERDVYRAVEAWLASRLRREMAAPTP